MKTRLTEDERQDLVARIERAALSNPEIVADYVLSAAAAGGYAAGEAELQEAIRREHAAIAKMN